MSTKTSSTLQEALRHHAAGRLAQAEALYRRVLGRDPKNIDALHLMGLLECQAGRSEAALERLAGAIRVNPRIAIIHNSLGGVLLSLGRLDEAIASFERAAGLQPDCAEARANLAIAHLNLAGGLHAEGKDEQAAEACRAAVWWNPELPEAHRNLAAILLARKQYAEAEAACREALRLKRDFAEAHHDLGFALQQQDRPGDAVPCYAEALRLKPGFAEAHFNLGNTRQAQRRFEDAIACYESALRLEPHWAEARLNLGAALSAVERLEEAEAACREAIRLKPELPEAHSELGNALQQLGRPEEALACYREALRLRPEFPEAHNNQGHALLRLGRFAEAEAGFQAALRLKPDYAIAHNNLGNALQEQDRLEEALHAYDEALRLRPDYPEAHNNRGNALAQEGRLTEGIAAFRQALGARPGYVVALNNLGFAMQSQGRIEQAIACYRQALAKKPDFREAHSNLLFALHYDAAATPEEVFGEHQRWGERFAAPLAGAAGRHANSPDAERRLRIGYVSPDFRAHSVSFFIEPVLAAHDRERFETFCYANVARPDRTTARLEAVAQHWRSICGMSDEQVCELVRADGIDILVDLAGHTAGNRLLVFARKPAPVAVTYLGYPDTTGVRAIDYRITDALSDPPGETERFHTEELTRLPEGFLCYQPPPEAPEVSPLPAPRLGRITFGSFNNLSKLSAATAAAWAAILGEVPGARLMLKAKPLGDEGTRARVLELFRQHGIADGRVQLFGRSPSLRQHLEFYEQVDIALDTFPYHGTTTTCEALWMGAPVVTLAGAAHASRVGLSLLARVGLGEFAARSPEEYIAAAAALARDFDRLRELRAGLRARTAESPLTGAARFTRALEEAYRGMWRRWCERKRS